MTKIKINEKYHIEVDRYNYTLVETIKYVNKKGEDDERDNPLGYYPALENALIALSHLMTIRELETYSIDEYITQSIECSKTIRNSLKLNVKDLEELK
ncbi:hypothetical protein [Aerococcus sp. L_32]|uniref:hypothetical protein n=1 Tax=Aerococcus sp. L_32 TaxID=3422316 RepID=UPI003D6A05AB